MLRSAAPLELSLKHPFASKTALFKDHNRPSIGAEKSKYRGAPGYKDRPVGISQIQGLNRGNRFEVHQSRITVIRDVRFEIQRQNLSSPHPTSKAIDLNRGLAHRISGSAGISQNGNKAQQCSCTRYKY